MSNVAAAINDAMIVSSRRFSMRISMDSPIPYVTDRAAPLRSRYRPMNDLVGCPCRFIDRVDQILADTARHLFVDGFGCIHPGLHLGRGRLMEFCRSGLLHGGHRVVVLLLRNVVIAVSCKHLQ